jgi:hypothetical protein
MSEEQPTVNVNSDSVSDANSRSSTPSAERGGRRGQRGGGNPRRRQFQKKTPPAEADEQAVSGGAPEPPPPPVSDNPVVVSAPSPKSIVSPKATRLSRSGSTGEDRKLDDNDCAICAESIPKISRFVVTKCGHNEICGNCVLRLRHIVGTMECPFCKEIGEEVLFLSTTAANPRGRKLEQYDLSQLPKDQATGIYFQSSRDAGYFRKLKSLYCPVCEIVAEASKGAGQKVPRFQSNAQLSAHLKSGHGKYVCDICMEHDHLFVSEYRLFKSYDELQQHINFGSAKDDKSLGTEPHQRCKFCQKMFYDKDLLFTHLHREHFHCHICHRNGGQTYFASYKQLFSHFKSAHFTCKESDCIEKKFVVFEDELRLRNHMLTEHANKLGSMDRKRLAQISMDYVFNDSDDNRRLYAGRRPENAAPQETMVETKAPEPIEPQDAFPSLQGSAASNYVSVPGSLSWAARNSSSVPPTSLDEFPSLPMESRAAPVNSSGNAFQRARNVNARPSSAEEFPALPPTTSQPRPVVIPSKPAKKQTNKKKGGKKESTNAWRDAISIAEPQVINPFAEEEKKAAKSKGKSAVKPVAFVSPIVTPEPSPGPIASSGGGSANNSRRGSVAAMVSAAASAPSPVISRKNSLTMTTSPVAGEDFPALPVFQLEEQKSAGASASSSRRSSMGEADVAQTIIVQCMTAGTEKHPKIVNRTASLRFKFLVELARDAAAILQSRLEYNPTQLRFPDRISSSVSRYVKSQLPPDQIRDNLFIKKLGLTNAGASTLTTLLQVAESGYSKSWAVQNLNGMDVQDLFTICAFVTHFS